jgi:hypothetical protein
MQNQILGHSSSRIFENFYQDLKVQHDVQNTFIGLPTDDKLLKTANLMSRTIDPRTPKTLDKTEIAEIEQCSQELQHLMVEASHAKEQCLQSYVKLKDAEGTPLHQRYVVAQQHVRNLSRRLRKEALAAKREQFEKFAAVDDVQRQIQGLPSTVPDISGPVLHFHPERTRVAAALFAPAAFELGSDEDVARRVATLTDLIALCSLREPRPRRSLPASFSELKLADVTAEDEPAMSSSEGTLCESPTSDVLDTDTLCHENLLPEILDMTGLNHSTCPTPTYEVDQHSHRPSPSDDLDMVEPSHDLLFTDFVNAEMCASPTQPGPKTCLICYFDISLGDGRTAASKFSRQDSMQRHARLVHFRDEPPDRHRVCPDSACAGQVFVHLNHFKNHAATEHGVFF